MLGISGFVRSASWLFVFSRGLELLQNYRVSEQSTSGRMSFLAELRRFWTWLVSVKHWRSLKKWRRHVATSSFSARLWWWWRHRSESKSNTWLRRWKHHALYRGLGSYICI
jgi:hypothetical protein